MQPLTDLISSLRIFALLIILDLGWFGKSKLLGWRYVVMRERHKRKRKEMLMNRESFLG